MVRTHRWRRAALAGLAGLAVLAVDALAAEGGSLLDRWRERMAQRSTDKAADLGNSAVDVRIHKPGDYRFEIEHGGMTRLYRIHVPASYAPDTPTPLLFSFHGGGGNMDVQADDSYYGFVTGSERAGYIAVFPNGYSPFRSGKLATWNAGICCAGARDKNIDDVGFVRQILKHLRQQLNIDERRIYATGMSNGALLSHRLACEMADTFRGIASVAGSDGTLHCQPTRGVDILEIHARDDEFVLFDGGAGKDSKRLADFVAVPETVARWVRRNQCEPTARRVLDRPGVRCEAYSGCRDGVRVQLCVTDTGGHSWPGGRKVRTGEAGSTALSATDYMWEFFNAR